MGDTGQEAQSNSPPVTDNKSGMNLFKVVICCKNILFVQGYGSCFFRGFMEMLKPFILTETTAMDKNKILESSLLDLLFEDRNKAYGAYDLRKTYNRRVTKAMMGTGTIVLLAVTGTLLARSFKPVVAARPKFDMLVVEEIKDKPKEPEQQPKKTEVQQVKTIQYTAPVIAPDEEATPVPENEDLDKAVIDTHTQEGIDDPRVADPAPVDDGKGIVDTRPNDNEPLSVVEIDAKFNGDWVNFLRRNLDPQVPVDNGASPGRYTVIIQFVVDREGKVSDIKPLTNIGYGMEEEAVRVLKRSSQWTPAIQNGYNVKAYHKQMVIFEVTEE